MGTLQVNGAISATGTISASSFLGNASSSTYAKYLHGDYSSVINNAAGDYNLKIVSGIPSSATGIFATSNNANAILTINKHSGNYDSQLGFSSNGNLYYRSFNGTAVDTSTGWQQIITSANYSNYSPNMHLLAMHMGRIYTGDSGAYWDIDVTNFGRGTMLISLFSGHATWGTFQININQNAVYYNMSQISGNLSLTVTQPNSRTIRITPGSPWCHGFWIGNTY